MDYELRGPLYMALENVCTAIVLVSFVLNFFWKDLFTLIRIPIIIIIIIIPIV